MVEKLHVVVIIQNEINIHIWCIIYKQNHFNGNLNSCTLCTGYLFVIKNFSDSSEKLVSYLTLVILHKMSIF